MNFGEWLLELIKPEVEEAKNAFNAILVGERATALAGVAALETKDVPSVAAYLASLIPEKGLFGGLVKSEIGGFLSNALSSLTKTIGADDGEWYDELIALVEAGEAKAGL